MITAEVLETVEFNLQPFLSERQRIKSREDSDANLSFPRWNNTEHIKTSLNLNSLTEITIDLQIKN